MKRDNSKFQVSAGRTPTYKCGVCGKLTRETGHDESSVELCAFCYEEAGLENALSDGVMTQTEFDKELEMLKKKYGRSVTVSKPWRCRSRLPPPASRPR